MTYITIPDLIDELHIPIVNIQIDGNLVHIGTVGTCVVNGTSIVEHSLNWDKIYNQNKKKLNEAIFDMYGVNLEELEITTKPNRILQLKFKGKEMFLHSIEYKYHSNGEWTFQRANIYK